MTHDSAPTIFDAHAAGYDAARRRLIPPFDRFYDTAVEALALATTPPQRILDLGAGTGLLSRHVADAYPHAELHLLDAAPAMLEQALHALGDRARIHVGDLADPLPPGPFGAVVSSLAIHHLDDPGKRDLFARVRAVLQPGGVFVNAEQVLGPTPRIDAQYAAWHKQQSFALGCTQQEWDESLQRRAFDLSATVSDQLDWLADAGFTDVDCLFQDHLFAVLVARRPG
jgi:tRNA (cmo5U34)-methyltransferase